jgi:internalin A
MPDQSKPVSRPWRRFLRFSVRGMIVLVLVIGVWLGWIVHSARVQRQAVAAIERAGGKVAYDWEYVHRSRWSGKLIYPSPNPKPIWPKWLIQALGPDYFGDVVSVRFLPDPPGRAWTNATDEVMLSVGKLARLNALDLTVAPVTDAGLAHLSHLADLTSVELTGTKITGAGLASLRELRALRYLGLDNVPLSDADLTQLGGAKSLESLRLTGRKFTDAGFLRLKGLVNLKRLQLSDCRVTDAGLLALSDLTQLKSLILIRTHVRELAAIRHLTGLTELFLAGSPVTDAGLANLQGLTNLKQLNIMSTEVTNAGVKELQQALPSLTIAR